MSKICLLNFRFQAHPRNVRSSLWKVMGLCLGLVMSCWLVMTSPAQAQQAKDEQIRIWPTNNTTLLTDQKFDLRVESLVPTQKTPTLESLRINGQDITNSFNQYVTQKLQQPGGALEVGQPPANSNLFGQTWRNFSYERPGTYKVEATFNLDGKKVSARNTYRVQAFEPRGGLNKIIFYVGDGMGTPLRTGARLLKFGVKDGQPGGKLHLEQLPDLGLVATHSLNSIVPDSANTAAAWASGAKTINNAMNAFPDNTPDNPLDNPRIETLPQYMKRKYKWGIGMVTTAFTTDATPGSFASNIVARSQYESIAQQFLDYYDDSFFQPATGYRSLEELTQPVDVILGPGGRYFVANKEQAAEFNDSTFRRDKQDLVAVARKKGYTIVRDLNSLKSAPNSNPILSLFKGDFRSGSALGAQNTPSILDILIARGRATIDGRGASQLKPPVPSDFAQIPTLAEMTQKAIEILEARSPQGWMLQVESSQVDKLAHPLDPDRTLYEVLTLDEAVKLGRDFASKNPNTLIIATADHAQGQTMGGTVDSLAIREGRIDLEDAFRSFENAGFTTYQDENGDGYPDEANPTIKIAVGISARPTFTTDFLTDDLNLPPTGEDGADPNPQRDPNGLLLTNDLQRSTTVANHTADDVPIATQGPGSRLFEGLMDNIEVFQRMAAAISGARELNQATN